MSETPVVRDQSKQFLAISLRNFQFWKENFTMILELKRDNCSPKDLLKNNLDNLNLELANGKKE